MTLYAPQLEHKAEFTQHPHQTELIEDMKLMEDQEADQEEDRLPEGRQIQEADQEEDTLPLWGRHSSDTCNT